MLKENGGVLGIDKILNLVKKKNLVEGLSKRELETPEGSGLDVRLGKVWKISGESFLGIEERKTGEAILLMEYIEDKSQIFELKPKQHVLVTSMEKFNIPKNITANFYPRGTLIKSGVGIIGGPLHAGYTGEITFSLFNVSENIMKIEMGARFIHVQFSKVDGRANLYKGQWQNGRVSAPKMEKQI